MMRLSGKVIVMVGGAGGIGTATSLRLALEGASLVVGDLNVAGAEAVAARIVKDGGSAIGVPVNLVDEDSMRALFAAAVERFGGVDGAHVNAADLMIGPRDTDVVDMDIEVWKRVIDADLTGYFYATRHAVPALLARGGGAIVYTGSTAAFTGDALRPGYACAKSAVNALARHVATRWGKQGIRANVVSPGLILTDTMHAVLTKEFIAERLAAYRTPRLGNADDVAGLVAMLMSAEGHFIQGQILHVNGGGYMH